jgi:hypothetical protein
MLKLNLTQKAAIWYFDIVALNHNHPMSLQQRMVRFMHAYKSMEDGVKNLMDVLMRSGVQHQAQMHVMSELHGGRDKWTFTERDMKNRYE